MPHFQLIFIVLVSGIVLECITGEKISDTKRSLAADSLNIPEGWKPIGWPDGNPKLGPVSGVTLDNDGHVYVFHRVDRIWNENTFDVDNNFKQRSLGPILEPTILVYHSNGTLISARGKGMFYMPHGITVDGSKNIWVTDVALHQVIKLSSSDSPLFTLGEEFVPGKDSVHFCKPTSVAVAKNGDFFVSDGYCNSRILKFNYNGVKILEWGRSPVKSGNRLPDHTDLYIPHALTLAESRELVCVADRENGRVSCFDMNNSSFITSISSATIGSRVFSVAFSPAKGGIFFLVNGPFSGVPVQGFVASMDGSVISRFGPNFSEPHDVAVSPDANHLYVAEINPFKIWKFVPDSSLKSNTLPSRIDISPDVDEAPGKLTGAFLIVSFCIIFAAAIIIGTLVYSKSKKTYTPDTVELLTKYG